MMNTVLTKENFLDMFFEKKLKSCCNGIVFKSLEAEVDVYLEKITFIVRTNSQKFPSVKNRFESLDAAIKFYNAN